LHPSALRRARARDGAPAVRSADRRRAGRRRHRGVRDEPRLGHARNRVLRGGDERSRDPRRRAAAHARPRDVGERMIFTSDLSIHEILLVREAGFEPLELVQGSSYYHIGWSSAPWTTNMELAPQSQVMLSARHLAMSRLLEQATAAGADG